MIWTARNEARLFGASPVDVDLDGAVLTVQSKRTQPRFDLRAADVAVTRHQWNMSEGTALQVRRGAEAAFIAVREAFFPELRHETDALMTPDLVMTASDFTSFQEAVMRALPETAPARQALARRQFLLWDDGLGTGLPALALFLSGGLATLERLRPKAHEVARAALSPGRIEHMRRVGGVIDLPVVRLTFDPVWKIDIGCLRQWAGTHGPYITRPKYTVGHPWWPGLMQALTAACAANQHDSGGSNRSGGHGDC